MIITEQAAPAYDPAKLQELYVRAHQNNGSLASGSRSTQRKSYETECTLLASQSAPAEALAQPNG